MTLRAEFAVEVGGFAVECSLAVEAGETVALVGPNGAGKSTVLRAIAGLQPIDRGTIRFGDTIWDQPSQRVFVPVRDRGVGIVFQDYALFGHLSAADNVAFGLRASGTARRAADARARAMIERLEIGHVADRRPGELSGGEAQRVAIARAIVGDPALVLLDEPLAALDASTRSVVRRELPGWLGRGADAAGRIIVTHDPVDADALADRVVVLEGGSITQRGTVRDLAMAPRSPYVADLMGTNLLRGELAGHRFVVVDGGGELMVGAHELADGAGAVAAIRPAAVALHRTRPEGSPRNVWASPGRRDRSVARPGPGVARRPAAAGGGGHRGRSRGAGGRPR